MTTEKGGRLACPRNKSSPDDLILALIKNLKYDYPSGRCCPLLCPAIASLLHDQPYAADPHACVSIKASYSIQCLSKAFA